MTAISQAASLQKREPSFFTAKNGMSAMEPGRRRSRAAPWSRRRPSM